MRIAPSAFFAVPLLLLLLTWLSFGAVNADAEIYDQALQNLDRVAVTESALQRDVLMARAGSLRNYDPLVWEIADLYGIVGQMHCIASPGAHTAPAIEALAASVRRQEELIERFKTENALLQNSLAYFGLFGTAITRSGDDSRLLARVSALAAAMLHLTLDTSPASSAEVADRLDRLMEENGARDDPGIQALLAHGRMLHRLLPSVDEVLRTLVAIPVERQQAELRAMVLTHQSASRDTARRYRLLLYAVSVSLVVLLVHLGLRLRSRALSLQRRAALEHLITGLSLGFIDAPPHELGLRIERALAALAEHLGAERAYFLLFGRHGRTFHWSADGAALPDDWAERTRMLAARTTFEGKDVVQVPPAERVQAGPKTDSLSTLGLRDWACVSRMTGQGEVGLLGFDGVRSRLDLRSDERGLLRMAFDVFANAVGRQCLEQERVKLARRLQQARRMETVGTFASGIAHNFNNIVGAILGYAEMAEERVHPRDRSRPHLSEIRRAGERARDLIDQILTFGRRRDAARRPIRVSALVAESASLLRASLPPGIELTLREGGADAVVSGDATQLQQVILNLGNNAAQAMDGEGPLLIRTEIRQVRASASELPELLAAGRYVRILVEDRGRGMDEATRSRIFEPFFSTRPAGNGLGLATAREIVREHSGTITVASQSGAGTCFAVWLPCTTNFEDARSQAIPRAAPALLLGQGQPVLVFDPDPTFRLREEEVLAALGYEPVGYSQMAHTLLALKQAPDRFAAALIGQPTSPASGLCFASSVHREVPRLPLILATGSAADDPAALARAGIHELVQWPLIASEVAMALARVLPQPEDAMPPEEH
ncbi:two-component system VirA-like sensor kinase [Methylobacterium soli]|uniref:histidine kinase n=1 Tax=Methylobacterium soli TaxID=553447 RepID=A0A6L3SR85_9HYPH|nr:two-component system VirA-like sensor kinase [Methylobacterium soli]KAB1072929.1 two-component system VirA-like sensor kinase [Methylobacterium soli]GJE42775.1 Wide host range VirA protein [Methylobacterium soli]